MFSLSSFIEKTQDSGFLAVGFSRPARPLFFDRFCAWVAAGKNGGMLWLKKHLDLREDPTRLLEDCQTIVTMAYPYSANKPHTPDGFTTARYSEPGKTDYHDRLRKLAQGLAKNLVEWFPGSRTRICIDSAPILERSYAYASGIGFIGKNNMLIIPGHGSYLFLAEILTTASLPFPESTPMQNRCGSCTRCIDACPSGALENPFLLDASRCLSYLTIEDHRTTSNETGKKMGKCFFGCDICQEVCPFNEKGLSEDPSLPSTDEILRMEQRDFREKFGGTALARPGLEKLKDNIRTIRL